MENLRELLSIEWLGMSLQEMFISFSLILFTLIFRRLLVHCLFLWLRRFTARTRVKWDDKVLEMIERPVSIYILFLGLFLAFIQLPLDPMVTGFAIVLFRGITIAIIFWAIIRLSTVFTEVFKESALRNGHAIGTFMPLIHKATRIFLVMLGVALTLQNFGIEIGPVLGALGIGGAAIAFAAKDTIANLYGSLALALDRPFKVGDWIMIGDKIDGDVEEIGLRSTKVRTWPKTQLSIPNQVLANEVINNWTKMPMRRVKQYVGVTYESTPEQMEGLVEDIKAILRNDAGVQQDFMLVSFTDFGSSSLDILVYYFSSSVKWLEYMDVRQRINLAIMRAVSARGMSVAFPTRTLYFEGDVARGMAGSSNPQGQDPSSQLPGDAGPNTPP